MNFNEVVILGFPNETDDVSGSDGKISSSEGS